MICISSKWEKQLKKENLLTNGGKLKQIRQWFFKGIEFTLGGLNFAEIIRHIAVLPPKTFYYFTEV